MPPVISSGELNGYFIIFMDEVWGDQKLTPWRCLSACHSDPKQPPVPSIGLRPALTMATIASGGLIGRIEMQPFSTPRSPKIQAANRRKYWLDELSNGTKNAEKAANCSNGPVDGSMAQATSFCADPPGERK